MLEKVFEIRRKVFVVEQCVDAREEYDEFDATAHHYLATLKGVPVGTARWRPTEKGIKLERFAVLKEARGSGVGAALLARVLEDVRQQPREKTYLHAQLQVVGFYAKHGFEAIGDVFEEAGIKHRVMVLKNQ